ncbi:MAG: hypothetical protein F8N37_07720 [Telmatospirillum sp.]|nr:hypothetical protein [Telmatospirillum sp.]
MALTRQQVIEVVGRIDDDLLVEIIETGATQAELLEAKQWVDGQCRPVPAGSPLRSAIIEEVHEILAAEDPGWDEV